MDGKDEEGRMEEWQEEVTQDGMQDGWKAR